MLKLENISVTFGKKEALKNLSCTVEDGDFIVIVGTNGAGKSTFFDVIAGKVMPSQGTITLDEKNITNIGELERASYITRLFQNTQLNSVGSMTVYQNLAMAHYSRRKARLISGTRELSRATAIELVRPLGGNPDILLDTPMASLSGGQRQRIAFIMSTLKIPKVLLLDEPTAALDPSAATGLLQTAGSFIKKHKVTTLLITHDPHIALSMGNKVWILENGTITQQFGADEKRLLNPDKLIGQIDYAALKN